MSRTFRRKGGDPSDKLWAISDYVRIPGTWCYKRVYYEVGSKEYNKGLARYHSDAGTTGFKEPGPAWFRNMFSERPQRRFNKRELQRYMLNEQYEPMIIEKFRLEYWT